MEFLLKSDIKEICDNLGSWANQFSGKTVLLAGGRGFLGRYFSEVFKYLNDQVLKNPVHVIVLDNLITAGVHGSIIPQWSNFQFINHDITKPFDPDRKVDFILQAAGIASPYYYRKYPLQTLEVATVGLKNTLELAKKHGSKILFFSSSEIYGDPDIKHVPTPESYRGNVSCLGPRSSYDESKRLGETMVKIYQEQYGVHGTIVRPFNIFSGGMQKTDYRVLPNFFSKIIDNEAISIYGTGNQTRTFCYGTDGIEGFLRVMIDGVPGEPYNIGNPNPEISMSDLADLIESKIVKAPIKRNIIEHPDSYPADEPNRRCPDITKARTQLGYNPKVSLEDGLHRFYGWAQKAYRE